MPTNLILTSGAEHLVPKFKHIQDFKIIFSNLNKDGKRSFPDGEIYTRLPNNIKGETVIIHSGMPNPNRGLVELEMLLEVLRSLKASPIKIFFTYFAYGQQDDVFENGEVNFAESMVKKYIEYYKVQRIYVLDAHFFGRTWVKNYPIVNVSAVEMLETKAKKDFSDIVFCAPDIGCQRRTGLKGVEKKRKNSFESEIKSSQELKQLVEGKNIGVVDDLLETGGTMTRFYDLCKSYNAKNIVALITHGVLPEGIERVKNKFSKLYLSNSIKNQYSNIDISPLIIKAITSLK